MGVRTADGWKGFEYLYRAECERLVRVAVSAGAPSDEARDIVHDAFAALLQRRDALKDGTSAGAYLAATVRNLVKNQLKHRHIADEYRNRAEPPRPATPQEVLECLELEERIRIIVNAFPPRRRRVCHLYFEEHLNVKSIADELRIAPATVHVQLHKARKALWQALSPRFLSTTARRYSGGPNREPHRVKDLATELSSSIEGRERAIRTPPPKTESMTERALPLDPPAAGKELES